MVTDWIDIEIKGKMTACLNPYCNGRWSLTGVICNVHKEFAVLILIVMEDGH